MRFDFGIYATTGARRRQEDSARVLPLASDTPATALAAVLSDGMGGHAGGAVASTLACETFLPEFVGSHGPIGERLRHALDVANAAIATYIEADPTYSGMGATLIATLVDHHGLQWVSVGDSLLYLVRGSDITLLNADHSLAPEIDRLAELGHISWSEALSDPRRHYLRSAITGDEIELIDLPERARDLREGDTVIIASDGLNTLSPAEIADIVAGHRALPAKTVAERLVQTVLERQIPHQDNTTVVVIQAVGG